MRETQEIEVRSPRVIEITVMREAVRKYGWARAIWGVDIWVNGIPLIKVGIAANLLAWALLWLAR